MRNMYSIILTALLCTTFLLTGCESCKKAEEPQTTTKTAPEVKEPPVEETKEPVAKEPVAEEPKEKEAVEPKAPEPKMTKEGEKQMTDKAIEVAGVKITDNEKAVIETNLGNIEIVFFTDVAPKHVENFKKLARQEFYNGTTFHRVIPGFMIQGGDPNSKDEDRSKHGMGGPGYTVDAEFNDRPHLRGTLSMARSGDPNSAGSQFFVCVKDSRFLDGKYTVFGHVLSGLDIADRIVSVKRDARDNPLERVVMNKVVIQPL